MQNGGTTWRISIGCNGLMSMTDDWCLQCQTIMSVGHNSFAHYCVLIGGYQVRDNTSYGYLLLNYCTESFSIYRYEYKSVIYSYIQLVLRKAFSCAGE